MNEIRKTDKARLIRDTAVNFPKEMLNSDAVRLKSQLRGWLSRLERLSENKVSYHEHVYRSEYIVFEIQEK